MGNIGSSTPSYFNTPQTGAQYRVTPQNYRQILGDQADIVLKPEQMKDMFEKGYLDVQRQFTEQESNEGIFTIAAKAMAAFIGPSKSIGAITIDPKFLEMIKDPNAEIGFGYTRLRQETLSPLPYPADPPRTETPPTSTEPALTQTDIPVTTPQEQTEQHRDELVRFRKEQEESSETPGTSGSYMVERNSGQNNAIAGWNSKYNPTGQIATRLSSEYGGLIKKYEAAGVPSNWNAELVQDATWEGAYVEAITQDRDAAVRFQYVTRGSADFNTATNRGMPPEQRATARARTEQMISYINKEGAKATPPFSMTMAQAEANPSLFKDNMAKAFGFSGGYSDIQAINKQAQDFRITGYISGDNPRVATEQVGGMSKGTANGILDTQITGRSQKADGTENFYDTVGMLESRPLSWEIDMLVQQGGGEIKGTGGEVLGRVSVDRSGNAAFINKEGKSISRSAFVNQVKRDYQPANNIPGFKELQAQYPNARTMMDVYAQQTKTMPIPDNAKDEYAAIYTRVMGSAPPASPPPTLQDMYVLRTAEFRNPGNPKAFLETGSDGHLAPKNPNNMRDVLNVRLVLEANNGRDQVHRFDQTAIDVVNARATSNFANVTLNLSDNLGQNTTTSNAATINRVQITAEDSEAVDTVKLELGRTGVLNSPTGERLATFQPEPGTTAPKVLKDGQGNVIPPERQAAFLADVAQKSLNPTTGRSSTQLEGGVGYGYVGGTTGTSTTTRTQTPEVTVRASEMQQLAEGKAPQARVDALKASLGITGEISQQDLFKRVLTEAFGQSPEQATTALTGAQSGTAPFSFPKPAETSAVQFGTPGDQTFTPIPPTAEGVVKTEAGPTTTRPPSVEARTASLNANLNVMGELDDQAKLIPKNKESVGQLKAQILADLTALEGSPPNPNATVKIGDPPVDTPISTVRASVNESFAKIEASVAEGEKALRAQAVQAGLGADADPSQVLASGGLPAIPAANTADPAGFQKSVQDSVKAFSGQLREMVRDGDISTEEKAKIDGWWQNSTNNLLASVQPLTQDQLFGSDLAGTLRANGITDPATISTISQTAELLKNAKANVNITPEARSFHKVLDNVHSLQQKIKEFETVGVLRAAFAGEMKELATNNPDRFKAVIQGAYSIPDTEAGKKVIEDMTTMAREGNLPIPPNISFVDPAVLPGANAAYAAKGPGEEPMILLSRDLLDKPGALRDAFAAEMFHHAESSTRELHQGDLAADGSFDSIGDEGQAGLKALRAAQNMESTEAIAKAAADGRNTTATAAGINKPESRPAGTELAGYDHGTVTLPDLGTFKVEFQSAAAAPGAAVQGNPAAQPREIGGLATPGINPHATSRRYTEVKHVDNLPPTNDPIELRRREHISSLDEQMRTFESTPQKNEDGTPMTEPQKNQKFQKLQKDRNDLVGMNAVQYAQTYNIQPPAGSTHQMEQPPEDFLGKAKEMGGQAINGILQFLSTGAPGALCDQIAAQIEGVWKSFYSSVTQNSSAADRSIAEDVVQSGFDVGRDANYEASRTNLINPQGKGAVGQSIQNYRNANPGLRQDKGMLGEFADQDERHRKAFNGVFNR
ncbi:MAG: hypothetical protein AB7I41_09000 [Candidatus Sericytochromatia bacterium]